MDIREKTFAYDRSFEEFKNKVNMEFLKFKDEMRKICFENKNINVNDLADDQMLWMMERKCRPIVRQIEEATKKAAEKHVVPKRIIMSPSAYLALRFACRISETELSDYDRVFDMQIIVDHTLTDYEFRILGSNKDEVNHQDNYFRRKAQS